MTPVYFLIFLLALGEGTKHLRIQAELGSGYVPDRDDDPNTSAPSTVFLIDDYGDIHSRITETPGTSEYDIWDDEKAYTDSSMTVTDTTTPKDELNFYPEFTTEAEDDSTAEISSTIPKFPTIFFTTYGPESKDDSTTEISSSTTEYTTSTPTEYSASTPTEYTASTPTEYTASTVIPTTISDEDSTATTKQAFTFRSTTTMMENNNKSTNQVLQMPTAEATPYAERHVCTFMDTDLICNEDIVCYGEGEIDCTGDGGMTFIDKISLSSISEDYSDYDAAEDDTVGTFPPNLIGVITPKKIPFLFNMRSFATTGMDINSTSESPQDSSSAVSPATTESTSSLQSIAPTIDENKDSVSDTTTSADTSQNPFSTMETDRPFSTMETDRPFSTMEMDGPFSTMETEGTEEASTSESLETTMSSDEKTESVTEAATETDNEWTTSKASTMDSEATSDADDMFNIRKKRQDMMSSESDSSSSSMSMSFHVAALESPKKKLRAKVCRLSGDLVCMPTPTTAMCKGKSVCQATSSTAETAESSSAKGVETWALVVIVVCGLSGCLTVILLIYLVVTSCKKLKVQPSLDVTTLNYINRRGTANEIA